MSTQIKTVITTIINDDGTIDQTTDTTTVSGQGPRSGTVKLSSGQRMPLIGLGTWQAPKGEVGAAVKTALEVGYRHIDCAACYGNEDEVGEALADVFASGKVKRNEVFITSKLWNSEHDPKYIKSACEMTLRDLKLDYLDLYIIHWPQAFEHVEGSNRSFPKNPDGTMKYDTKTTLLETWAALENLVDAGLVKAIGLSNFNAAQVDEIVTNSRIKPVCNQVESHPFFQQDKLIAFCAERGVQVTAYSPLGTGAEFGGYKVFNHPTLEAIGARHGVSAAQVAIAFQATRKVPTFPKSVKASRIAENLGSAAIKLTADDMAEIRKIDGGVRGGWAGPLVERNGRKEPRDYPHPNYPFKEDVPAGGL